METIESYVFFDIETTGLPHQERNQTKITELSFVAALRKDIEATSLGNIPPVSKLTFVLNPQRRISEPVKKLTGLSNDLLRHAPVFREKIKSMLAFLDELPKPICLVAHNGNCFDYKILKTEFMDANMSLPQDLLCVDSLTGFRRLLKGTNISYKTLISSDEDECWPELNISNEEWLEIDELSLTLSDISIEERSGKEGVSTTKEKESFTLPTLYKRLLNKKDYNAHRAEDDCLMLLECVVALKSEFLLWADRNCKLLEDIVPLKRK